MGRGARISRGTSPGKAGGSKHYSNVSKDGQRRVIIACGGTGGHLFPGIAVADCLRRRGHEVLILISEKEIDRLASEGHGDFEFRKLPAIGLGRVFSLKTVNFLTQSWKAYGVCRGLVDEFRADTVLGMGGFTSTPPIVAGKRKGCRTLVHDSNAIPGKANRLTARFCDVVLLGVAEAANYFPKSKTRVVGTPVRAGFREPVPRGRALDLFGLEEGVKTLLVMGGSQGARRVNRLVCEALRVLDGAGVALQVIHLTGPGDHGEVTEACRGLKIRTKILPFCHEMQMAYTVADLAISRAGGSSLAELAFFGVPSILIPYPHAAEDHQRRNAEVFVRAGAAVMADEKELTGEVLSEMLRELCRDAPRLAALSEKASQLGAGDAAEEIARAIEEAPA